MTIDPRLAERRKTVAEDKAKRNMGRLLKFLSFCVVVGALVWLVFSPWLSISLVRTSGVAVSSANSILTEHQVVAGTPMILIDPAETEAALTADPWIASAVVRRHWPNEVTVEIVERVPVAWSLTSTGWTRRAVDGVALPSAAEPDDSLGRIEMPALEEVAAETATEMLGALEFYETLPDRLHDGAVVRMVEGELWAEVGGFPVRLGRPVEMAEKATSLTAMLEQRIPPGSTINMIAPTNPAYSAPSGDSTGFEDDDSAGSNDESEAEGDGEGEDG